jgi:acetyl-CoA C-acetyltransferase
MSSSMSSQRSVVCTEPVRTAIGAFGGAFKDIPAPDLGAAAIRACGRIRSAPPALSSSPA